MKKYFLILSLSVFCFACGNQTNSADSTKTTTAADDPDYDKGLNLVAKSDCFTCHKLRDASTGPAYGAVAAKYENNESNRNKLADKIIAGGSGVWGQIAMTPHATLPKDDAIAMVKYILLLKEEKK